MQLRRARSWPRRLDDPIGGLATGPGDRGLHRRHRAGGRYLTRPVFRIVAKGRLRELFSATGGEVGDGFSVLFKSADFATIGFS